MAKKNGKKVSKKKVTKKEIEQDPKDSSKALFKLTDFKIPSDIQEYTVGFNAILYKVEFGAAVVEQDAKGNITKFEIPVIFKPRTPAEVEALVKEYLENRLGFKP